jgi:hypothetical protein
MHHRTQIGKGMHPGCTSVTSLTPLIYYLKKIKIKCSGKLNGYHLVAVEQLNSQQPASMGLPYFFVQRAYKVQGVVLVDDSVGPSRWKS